MVEPNIYIGKEGITLRIDNGPWLNAPVALGATTVNGITQIQGGLLINNTPAGAVSLRWKGHTLFSNIPWALDMPAFNYSTGGTESYNQFYVQGNLPYPSPGGLNFVRYQSAGGYVTGTFIIEKAGKMITGGNTTLFEIHSIEGFFNVKIAN